MLPVVRRGARDSDRQDSAPRCRPI